MEENEVKEAKEPKFRHTSVLLPETLEQLSVKADGTYMDGTLGGGGHSYEIAGRLGENGSVLTRMTRRWKPQGNGWNPSGTK